MDIELLHQAVAMAFDRSRRNAELSCDLLAGKAFGDELKHFTLGIGRTSCVLTPVRVGVLCQLPTGSPAGDDFKLRAARGRPGWRVRHDTACCGAVAHGLGAHGWLRDIGIVIGGYASSQVGD